MYECNMLSKYIRISFLNDCLMIKSILCVLVFNLPDVFTFTAAETADEYGDDNHSRDHRDSNDENLEIHC